MADENWQKVREVFDSALRRKPAERQKYLVRACGADKTLLVEVESLLASLDSAESFLEQPAVAEIAKDIEIKTKGLENGQDFGPYRIIKSIGTGGMGEVYLAEDKRLDREVAVKILNVEFSRHESNLRRFIREAKSASALNHPNILVIHEIGESQNTHYIVSEYIKGKTLREFIREKSRNLNEILDIAIQTASALVAAHEVRLVHRDIKPENVMVRPDGFIKVLDFGLAKLVEQKNKSFFGSDESIHTENQTAKGLILGTVNYMSPEQAKGKRVDERTDIFSFGVLLYEMIAGKTPFQGDSVSETFANLINQEPAPLDNSAARGPAELQRIIAKTLRKKKEERYQTMKEVLADLKELNTHLTLEEKSERRDLPENRATALMRVTAEEKEKQTNETQYSFSRQIKQHKSVTALILTAFFIGSVALGYFLLSAPKVAGGDKKSIAVLPLNPINSAKRDEIYEIGIADSLIHRLSSMKEFVVRPLGAIRKYADLAQDPLVAGREQQVDYVLASNYQLADGKIRVTAQLFNVATGQIEETKVLQKDSADLFAMQDAIAGEIGNALLARFSMTSASPALKRGTTNEEAYRLYVHGKNLTNQRSGEAAKKAVENFEQAIRLDPNFARAYAGLARAYETVSVLGGGTPRVENEKAKEAVKKALELDSNLAEGYAVRGNINLVYEWDFAAAEKDLATAMELEPNNDFAHWMSALLHAYRGQFDEALTEIDISLAISPGTVMYLRDRGRILYYARRYDEAIVEFKRAIEVSEEFGTVWGHLWLAYEMNGDEAMAYETFLKWQEIQKNEHLEDFKKAYQTDGWLGVRRKFFEFNKLEENKPGTNFTAMARQCARLGEKEQAFEYLNKAFEKRQLQIIMLKVEPQLDSLRDDPRFDELVRRAGLK